MKLILGASHNQKATSATTSDPLQKCSFWSSKWISDSGEKIKGKGKLKENSVPYHNNKKFVISEQQIELIFSGRSYDVFSSFQWETLSVYSIEGIWILPRLNNFQPPSFSISKLLVRIFPYTGGTISLNVEHSSTQIRYSKYVSKPDSNNKRSELLLCYAIGLAVYKVIYFPKECNQNVTQSFANMLVNFNKIWTKFWFEIQHRSKPVLPRFVSVQRSQGLVTSASRMFGNHLMGALNPKHSKDDLRPFKKTQATRNHSLRY